MYAPGVILLGDAAHPMASIRAQGINVALRDVIVAANHLVPLLSPESRDKQATHKDKEVEHELIDDALAKIQSEREAEINRVQKLQEEETAQNKSLPKNPFLHSLVFKLARLFRWKILQSWIERQYQIRHGVTEVKLSV